MARALMQALKLAGYDVELACRFRSWEGHGDIRRQRRLRLLGQRFAARLMRRYEHGNAPVPDVWFTYHLYHKAPDWLGPVIAAGLGIPYLVAEASHAAKQAAGPWAEGYGASVAALHQADAVIALNHSDIAGIETKLGPSTKIVQLKPFHDIGSIASGGSRDFARRKLSEELSTDPSVSWLVTVGMMRPGAKLASYELLAQALCQVQNFSWQLIVVGDGKCRADVEGFFRPLKQKVFFTGQRTAHALSEIYAAADVFLWPAINEAYGMAILEAQSAGLPVVAGDSGGVSDIVRDEVSGCVVPAGESGPFADATTRLLNNPGRRREMGEAARRYMLRDHDISSASRLLGQLVEQVAGA